MWSGIALLGWLVLFSSPARAQVSNLPAADDDVTGPLSKRIAEQSVASGFSWVLLPYRPTYILPVAYNEDINKKPIEAQGITSNNMENVELKFQISFLLPIWEDAFRGFGDLCFAYTQVSIWQAYDLDDSSPFRDTNYEPEFFLRKDTDYHLLGLHGRMISLGAVHQSNGRGSEALSRSWNRLYADFMFERDNFVCSVKPWWRIPEDEDEDNNPDIEDYLGYGEFHAAYKWGDQVYALMFRNNMKTDENRSTVQLDWTFPITKRIKGYVQYFDGYGEVLLDYDHHDRQIGVGFLLNDWL